MYEDPLDDEPPPAAPGATFPGRSFNISENNMMPATIVKAIASSPKTAVRLLIDPGPQLRHPGSSQFSDNRAVWIG